MRRTGKAARCLDLAQLESQILREHLGTQFFRSVFERRAPQAIPAVETALGATITQGNTTRDFTEELLAALTDAYQQADATHEPVVYQPVIEVRRRPS